MERTQLCTLVRDCTCIYNNVKVHTQSCIYQPHRHHLSHTHTMSCGLSETVNELSGQDQWAHAMNTLIYTQHLHYTHRYTHSSTQPTLSQLLLHLPPKCLHFGVTFCCNGHLTIPPQGVHIGITHQVIIQDLLCVFVCCSIDACLNILSDNSFTF